MSYARQQTNKWKKRAGVFALLCAVLVLLCAAALAAGDPVEVTVQADPTSFSAPGDMQVVIQVKNTGAEERELLLTGCLMNHYAAQNRR